MFVKSPSPAETSFQASRKRLVLLFIAFNAFTTMVAFSMGRKLATDPLLEIELVETCVTVNEQPVSSQTAYEESYGHFEAISDYSWTRSKEWARTFGSHIDESQPQLRFSNLGMWYFENYIPYFACPELKRLGGLGDGGKWSCNIHRLKTIEKRRISEAKKTGVTSSEPKGCLIYSIGSFGNYEWEDAMYEYLGGPICEIHIFDPSGDFNREQNKVHNMHFHKWGLKGSQDKVSKAKGSKAKGTEDMYLISFPEMLKKLGHENRIIDIFKIDCEGCEWTSYPDWISYTPIRQVLIETHTPHSGAAGQKFFDSFAENNLIMYSKEPNQHCLGACVEFSYIRLAPTFLNPE